MKTHTRASGLSRKLGIGAVSLGMVALASCGSGGGGGSASVNALKETPNVPVAVKGAPAPYDAGLIKSICTGKKKIKLGLAWGFLGNSWRQQSLAELKDEASKCPNITKVVVTSSDFDLQKSISDINSQVAQGVDVLIVMPDAGPGLIPAMRKASQAGTVVIAYANGENFPGKPGKDYYDSTTEIQAGWGRAWAAWTAKRLKGKGNVVFLGGPAGAPTSVGEFAGFTEELKKTPGVKMLTKTYTPTGWDPAKAQQAMAGLLTKYPKIDAVVTDYGATAVAAIRAFEAAGRPLVPTSSLALNELSCTYVDEKATNPDFDIMAVSSRTWLIRAALRRGVAVALGTKDDEPSRLEMPVVEDSLDPSLKPKCDKSLPMDLDLDAQLTPAQLKAKFAK